MEAWQGNVAQPLLLFQPCCNCAHSNQSTLELYRGFLKSLIHVYLLTPDGFYYINVGLFINPVPPPNQRRISFRYRMRPPSLKLRRIV